MKLLLALRLSMFACRRERSDKILGVINEPVAYYFPTKDSLTQFIKKYGKEIVNSKGMGKNYGFAGCDTYTFRRSKDNYLKYEWYYCTKRYYEMMKYKIVVYATQRTE